MTEKLLNPDGSGKFLEPEEKMKELKNRQRPNEMKEAVPPICPFMSTPDHEVSCTPRCKLYRQTRKGYECYIMEMQSISWNTRRQGGGQAPPPQY